MGDVRVRSLTRDCARFRFPMLVHQRGTAKFPRSMDHRSHGLLKTSHAAESVTTTVRISIRICDATRLRAPQDGVRSSGRPRPRRAISVAMGLAEGDLFCFRMLPMRAESRRHFSLRPRRAKTSRYLRMAAGREKLLEPPTASLTNPLGRGHPHLDAPERYKNNTLYFASHRLSSIGLTSRGAGTFDRIRT